MRADLTGQRFTNLLVISEAESIRASCGTVQRRWLVRCDCGNEVVTKQGDLRSGKSTACGCTRRKKSAEMMRTHGLSDHPLYQSWAGMIARCENSQHSTFAYYGGRGIFVCKRWRGDFRDFLADVGDRPEGKTLDRVYNDGPYAPWNFRWATPKDQYANSRLRRTAKLDAEKAALVRSASGTQADIAREFGVSQALVSAIKTGRVWTRPIVKGGECTIMVAGA